jgi:hypothetical protein
MLFLLWVSTTLGEGRLWERLRIYSGKYLFNKSKFYIEKFLIFHRKYKIQIISIRNSHICNHFNCSQLK